MNVAEAYILLHCPRAGTDEEIKREFRIEAGRWHPDRGGDGDAMRRMIEARDCLLSMTRETRLREWRRLKPQIDQIYDQVMAETEIWEARMAALASVTNTETPTPEPSVTNTETVTNKRRAAGWESRNQDKVREQTAARVKKHRARNPEQHREYMREYMRKRREPKENENERADRPSIHPSMTDTPHSGEFWL
ncbi:hypothetical protein BBC27_08760 [Acidithiobacillus ferrivorans]|uniref:J domain-containing protein n=1 Tax=Acidithiobacillus ferrivorans TaxID=160808 RepID=A0A1B9C028_9PROT|nr:J domain-containing protein [Acidithiobacillus ferrivorans]OCB03274.1 hypothetical protein BBC27_08760 [Acidithiobacillus ferrivorans]